MFFIGTSGFVYPHWRGEFYPEALPQKKWLGFYAKHFKTVEINATFYHSMKPQTFLNWRKTVGENFIFSIKGSRFITHIKRLKNCQDEVEKFFEGVDKLKKFQIPNSKYQIPNKSQIPNLKFKTKIPNSKSQIQNKAQGCKDIILWQLPPKFKAESKLLENFLGILPKNWRYAFEFRDKTWLSFKIYDLLKKYKVALVIQDSPYWPSQEVITADYTYLRFHGGKRLYTSNYSDSELEKWAEKMVEWNKRGIDVYVYFNNDALGYAVKNAKKLEKLVASSK